MAPAVILISCLLATMSCSTTAQSTTPPTSDQTNTAAVLTTDTTTTTTSITSLPATTPPASTTSTTPPAPAPTLTTTTTPLTPAISTPTTPHSPASTTTPPSTPPTTTTTPHSPASTTMPLSTPPTTTTAIPVNPPTLTTVTSYPSNATSIPVTTRPGVTNATTTTTTTTQTPVYGSCGNPDLCCSGRNDSCRRLNCFCDVACLRLRDCCPDFKHTCLTVKNSTNSTKPNTLPLTGKCSEPTLCCSGLNYNCFRGCFCDEACKQLNDCCPDLNSTCIFNTTTAAPPVNFTTAPPFISTATPPQVTSYPSNVTSIPVTTRPGVTNATTTTSQTPLSGSCGNPGLCCSGLNNSCRRLNCYCDVACLRLRDCCPDFKPTCLTVNNSSNGTKPNNTLPLTGKCSEPTLCCSGLNYNCFRGCFCDENCKQLNDCCPDLNSTCIFNTTTAAPPFNFTTVPPVNFTTAPSFNFTTVPPFKSTAALPKVLTVLEARVLTRSSSSEEERQAVMRQVGALLESLLGVNNTDIISLKVTRIKPVSSPYN